ncbi:MAG TPA: tRNA (adenosine(37)-N6)-threonylcarbamoyltransferase complex ATPase subunit type 1 TsaE [Polyangia bacterium]|nr:tRNA (adenosine(37)-N6)-threonylcarbamoyltransferase complex ATPase subunit type 1 TsaE [Polyangia bacterium]
MPPTFRTHSPAQTQRAAARLGRLLQAGDVVGLVGQLGAGKTWFVKGLAQGLGLAPAHIASPSFTIINEHAGGRLPLYHVDLYRLADPSELDELGLGELLSGEGVSAVEWIDRFPQVAPAEWLEVLIDFAGAQTRRLTVRGLGARGQTLARVWLGA